MALTASWESADVWLLPAELPEDARPREAGESEAPPIPQEHIAEK